ncbi:DNA-binding transcriptional regulator LsrR (DeoR family) [Clostridium saccharobutylicum]|nr:DNA-binding transcriptional regulator LsrR (DeoR family) [Clostridium saccharobutylicum]
MKENPEVALEIENKIREKYNLPKAELFKEDSAKEDNNDSKSDTKNTEK